MKKRWWLAMATVIAVVLTACGGDDDDDAASSGDEPTEEVATTTSPGIGATIAVTGVWARSSPTMASAGAAYMTIENIGGADDALLSASVDASVAGSVELHEVVMVEGDGGDMGSDMGGDMSATTMAGGMEGETDGEGTMRMQQVDKIDLPAGESVELKPGGYHIMLMDLAAPLEEGTTIEITLEFEKATSVTVSAEVRTE